MTADSDWQPLTHDMSSLTRAGLFFVLTPALMTLPLAALYVVLWEPVIMWDQPLRTLFPAHSWWSASLWILLAVSLNMLVHEWLHGLGWRLGKPTLPAGTIQIGFSRKHLVAYCHCRHPLTLRRYVLGLLMPFLVLGLLPILVALLIGQLHVMAFGLLSLTTVGGDLLIAYTLLRTQGVVEVRDHPTQLGCLVRISC